MIIYFKCEELIIYFLFYDEKVSGCASAIAGKNMVGGLTHYLISSRVFDAGIPPYVLFSIFYFNILFSGKILFSPRRFLTAAVAIEVRGHKAFTATPSFLNSSLIPNTHILMPYLAIV